VVLDTRPTANVTITVDPDAQTDVGAGAGAAIALTFTDADWDQPQTVTVTAVDDPVVEGSHTSTIMHAVGSGDPDYGGMAVAGLVADVADNDAPQVSITESGGSTDVCEAGTTSDSYTVALNSPPVSPVTVTVTPDAQTDVGAGAGVSIALTFTNGNWHLAQPVTVTAVDDALREGPHTSTIAHTAASSDPDYDGLAITDVVAIVTDNDSAGVTIAESGASTQVDEAGPTSDTYTLALNSQPTADVAITASCSAQIDLGAGPGEPVAFVFTPGDWDVPHAVVITAVDDDVIEGVHIVSITHSVAGDDADYAGTAVASVSVTVSDNDPEYVAPPPPDDDIPDADSEPEEPGDTDTTAADADAEDDDEPDDDVLPPQDDGTIVEEVTTTVLFPGLCGAIGLAALAMCLLGLIGLKRTKCGPGRRPHDPSAVHAAQPRHSVCHNEDDTHGDHLARPRR